MKSLHLLSTAALSLLLVAGLSPAARARTDEPDDDVRLLVLVVVDQMIPEQLDRLAPWLTGGFGRFVAEGEIWRAGAHAHGITETGPGHATIGTAVYPNRHGIVANGWPAREQKAAVYCAEDADARPLTGHGVLEVANQGRSPALLAVGGISDFMKSADPAAKCVGVSSKDRAAILTMGRNADWSLWWDMRGQGFMSSTYFGSELPPWVRDWNTRWTDRLLANGAEDFP